MEQITKQQVILIALLVAIITAIATSVSTVSLFDNPSGNSPQTIYKVIERSIDTVANIPTPKDESAPVTTTPTSPSVLSPADIATSGAKSIVRIYEKVNNDQNFVAIGVAVGSKDGILASALLSPHSNSSTYIAVTSDNRQIPVTWDSDTVPGGFTFFTFNYDSSEKNKVPPLNIKDNSALNLGSNVVALGGKDSGNVVSTGIITEFDSLASTTSATSVATSTDIMTTDMALSSPISGWLLFDTSGNLVGFETDVDADKVAHFINGAVIKAAISSSL